MLLSRTFENDNNSQHHPNTFKIPRKLFKNIFLLIFYPYCIVVHKPKLNWRKTITNVYENGAYLRKYGKKESIKNVFFNEIPDKLFFMSLCNQKEWASLTSLTDIQLAWFLLRSKQKFVLENPFYDEKKHGSINTTQNAVICQKELCECVFIKEFTVVYNKYMEFWEVGMIFNPNKRLSKVKCKFIMESVFIYSPHGC